jgi:hypothetical protein
MAATEPTHHHVCCKFSLGGVIQLIHDLAPPASNPYGSYADYGAYKKE